jgi:hypothetical protein
MKRYFFLVALFISIHSVSIPQKDSVHIARNVLYLEAAGAGGYGSLSYERIILVKKRWMLGARLGLSTYHINDYTGSFNPDIIIPVMIIGSYGKNNKIEMGAGETTAGIVIADFNNHRPKRDFNFHTTFCIGYRYQKNKGGIFFRCAYTPLLEQNRYFRHWAGLSLGYSF